MHKHTHRAHKTSIFKSRQTSPTCCVSDIHIKTLIHTMCPFSKDKHIHSQSMTACQWSCVHPEGMFVCVCVFRHCFLVLILLWLARLGEKPIITSHIDPHTLIHPCHSPSGGISVECVCAWGLGVWNTPSPLLYVRGHVIYRSTWEKDRVIIATSVLTGFDFNCIIFWFILLSNKLQEDMPYCEYSHGPVKGCC